MSRLTNKFHEVLAASSKLMYHGTSCKIAREIVASGRIVPSTSERGADESIPGMVYLTTSPDMAMHYAQEMAYDIREKGWRPAIVVVNTPSKLCLDEDIIRDVLGEIWSAGYDSGSVTYKDVLITPELTGGRSSRKAFESEAELAKFILAITKIHGVKYGKKTVEDLLNVLSSHEFILYTAKRLVPKVDKKVADRWISIFGLASVKGSVPAKEAYCFKNMNVPVKTYSNIKKYGERVR